MLAKLLVVVLGLGLCGGGLLSHRQQRLQAAHELTEARLRLAEQERELLALRARVAAVSTPGSLGPIVDERTEVGVPAEPLPERVD